MALTDNQKRSSVSVSHYAIGPGVDPSESLNDSNKQAIGYGVYGLLAVAATGFLKALMWFKR